MADISRFRDLEDRLHESLYLASEFLGKSRREGTIKAGEKGFGWPMNESSFANYPAISTWAGTACGIMASTKLRAFIRTHGTQGSNAPSVMSTEFVRGPVAAIEKAQLRKGDSPVRKDSRCQGGMCGTLPVDPNRFPFVPESGWALISVMSSDVYGTKTDVKFAADVKDYLTRAHQPGHGWGLLHTDKTSFPYTTSVAIRALSAYGLDNLEDASRKSLDEGISWLIREQTKGESPNDSDRGGWVTANSTKSRPSPAITAHVLVALAEIADKQGSSTEIMNAIEGARQFLYRKLDARLQTEEERYYYHLKDQMVQKTINHCTIPWVIYSLLDTGGRLVDLAEGWWPQFGIVGYVYEILESQIRDTSQSSCGAFSTPQYDQDPPIYATFDAVQLLTTVDTYLHVRDFDVTLRLAMELEQKLSQIDQLWEFLRKHEWK